MLLESFTLEIFNPACRPGAMAVHCFAHMHGLCLPGDRGRQRPRKMTAAG